MDFLKSNYYLDDNSIKDKIVDSLGDCLVQCAYIILKNKYKLNPNFYWAFLNELTIRMCISFNNKFVSFETIENVLHKGIFLITSYKKTNQNTAEIVSQILRSGNIPAISGIIEKFPFSFFYDESYIINKKRAKHVFIIVGEDEEHFFYVENPDILLYEKHISYNGNKEIGIISKCLFSKITQKCCDVLTFKFNMNVMQFYIKNPENALIVSRKNYYREKAYDNDVINYFGHEALKKLHELFKEESLHFNEIAPSRDRELITYFSWKIWNIKGRRKLNRQYLMDCDINKKNKKELIDTLEEAINCWDKFYMVLYRDYLKGENIMGKKYLSLIDNIILIEDELYDMMTLYLNR